MAESVTLETVMFRRLSAAAFLIVLSGPPLLAQNAPLSLCLVQTRPYASAAYDPPAGPWAIEMYDLLSAQKLRNGTQLRITVLAAATEKDVPPEVRRLHCPYVVQLRYHGDLGDLLHGGRTMEEGSDSVLFTLWNGATGKTIANGGSLILAEDRHPLNGALAASCASLAQQILNSLDKLR